MTLIAMFNIIPQKHDLLLTEHAYPSQISIPSIVSSQRSAMTGTSVSSEFLEPQTIDVLLRLLAFVCWSLNYINTMRMTIKSQLPSISFISICCDVGWEIVYAFIYPLASSHWAGGIRVWLLLHSIMMLTVMKYAPNEWEHAPFMKRYVPVAYLMVTAGFMAGQMALAAEIGPELGFHWGGALCQFIASFAGICHLVSRGSTRGISLKTWYVRSLYNVSDIDQISLIPKKDVSRHSNCRGLYQVDNSVYV